MILKLDHIRFSFCKNETWNRSVLQVLVNYCGNFLWVPILMKIVSELAACQSCVDWRNSGNPIGIQRLFAEFIFGRNVEVYTYSLWQDSWKVVLSCAVIFRSARRCFLRLMLTCFWIVISGFRIPALVLIFLPNSVLSSLDQSLPIWFKFEKFLSSWYHYKSWKPEWPSRNFHKNNLLGIWKFLKDKKQHLPDWTHRLILSSVLVIPFPMLQVKSVPIK